MNEPCEKYCYLPFRKNYKKKKVMNEFGRVLIKELIENPDGIMLPEPFGKAIILGNKYNPRDFNDLTIKHNNAKTGGILFSVYALNKVNMFKRLLKSPFIHLRTMKKRVRLYRHTKNAIFKMIEDDEWYNHIYYDTLGELFKNNK